ncbi:MAG: putative FAD dependent oxidoreductase [Caulobacteraceae bacterium]|nr:MAG: putative FAD dependent oxidoreductase [Caulobacteraceae bacterium]
MVEAEVIVIGAGMAGASAAAEMASSAKVLVLEQEDRPGRHATGRSAALYSEIYGNEVIRTLTRASRPALQDQDGRFARARGCFHIASASQIARLEAFAALPDVGRASRWLSGAEARLEAPVLREGYVAAAVAELNAYDLDVDALHQHYLRRLTAAGGEVRCDAPVVRAERIGGGWRVLAGGEEFHARIVVNAAGAWGDVVARAAGVDPVGLQPKRRTAVLVESPEGARSDGWPAVIDIGEQFYFKPDAGRILVSPADETPTEPCDAAPEEIDIAIAIDRVQAAADLPVRRVLSSWAGLRTFTPDRTPAVGFDPAAEGFFWLVGQGGYGIQTAPAMARLAAALALDRGLPADLADMGFDARSVAPGRFSGRAAS